MGSFIQMAAKAGASHAQAFITSRAADEAVDAAHTSFGQSFQEGERQKAASKEVAQANASDRVRAANKKMGAMIAAMADNGGMGTSNMVRYGGEIDYLAAMDLGRIDFNLKQQVGAINAAVADSYNNAMNVITSARRQAMGAWMNMIAGGMGEFGKTMDQRRATKEQTDKGLGIGRSGNDVAFGDSTFNGPSGATDADFVDF